MLNAAAWDFHPVSIAVPFLALGLLAVERKQVILLLCVSIILLACKEQMGLTVAGLGLLYGIRNRAWKTGLGFFLAGIAAFILIVAVVMPSYSLTGQHPMFGENVGQLSRYAWLGGNPVEVIKKIAFEPVHVGGTIVAMGGLKYLFLLLMPFLFLSLGGISWLLPAAADILVNLLSANPMPRSIFSYHSVTLIPIVAVAAIHGSCRLACSLKNISSLNLSYIALLVSLILGYGFAPLPLPGSKDFWMADHLVAAQDPQVPNIQMLIGDGSVSAQANVGAHFSQRTVIHYYPQKVGKTDFVILHLESPTHRLRPYDRNTLGTLAHHLMMDPSRHLDSVRDLLLDSNYGIVLWQDPWLVLQQGEGNHASAAQVLDKIEMLREEWSDPASR